MGPCSVDEGCVQSTPILPTNSPTELLGFMCFANLFLRFDSSELGSARLKKGTCPDLRGTLVLRTLTPGPADRRVEGSKGLTSGPILQRQESWDELFQAADKERWMVQSCSGVRSGDESAWHQATTFCRWPFRADRHFISFHHLQVWHFTTSSRSDLRIGRGCLI